MGEGIALALEEAVDGVAEFGMLEPVPGMGRGGDQPACELVLALRTAFEDLQPVRDRVLDALLVAGLEVQARQVFQRAPVAAVQTLAVLHAERARGGLTVAVGDDQHDVVGHGLAQLREEGGVEMRLAAVPRVGVGIASVEKGPVGVGAVAALDPAEAHPQAGELLPFLADLLALVVSERGEEIVEAGVALVEPVELESAAV